MTLRLFLFVDGDEVAAMTADFVPRVGEKVWCKTDGYEGTMVVKDVEHQFDRSSATTYSNHDVCLYCERAK